MTNNQGHIFGLTNDLAQMVDFKSAIQKVLDDIDMESYLQLDDLYIKYGALILFGSVNSYFKNSGNPKPEYHQADQTQHQSQS